LILCKPAAPVKVFYVKIPYILKPWLKIERRYVIVGESEEYCGKKRRFRGSRAKKHNTGKELTLI